MKTNEIVMVFSRSLPFLCLFSSCVMADDSHSRHPYLQATHMLSVGATYQDGDVELSSSVPNLPEISLDLDALGVDENYMSWMLEYRWRFKPRWSLITAAYTFEGDGNIEASRDFNYDGEEFKAGVSLETELEFDTYIIDVMYTAFEGDNFEAMFGGGLHVFDFSAAIKGTAFIGDAQASKQEGTDDLLAPLPNLRFQGFYAITDSWGLGLTTGWLSASYEDYDGSFVFAHLRSNYMFTHRLGASLGYQYNRIDLSHEGSRRRETSLDLNFSGPTIQLTYAL